MSDSKFAHVGQPEDKVIEECSELIKEICKARRFGYFNYHPQEPNRLNIDRVLDEIQDVEIVINELANLLRTRRR